MQGLARRPAHLKSSSVGKMPRARWILEALVSKDAWASDASLGSTCRVADTRDELATTAGHAHGGREKVQERENKFRAVFVTSRLRERAAAIKRCGCAGSATEGEKTRKLKVPARESRRGSKRCSGGFAYLIGGKYAQDYGVVDEHCNPYTGRDGPCKTSPNCTRHYVAKYRYCGGYYGASNEEVMRLALVHGGPIAVGFEVYPDFQTYSGGVYQHTTLHRQLGAPFDPFELTNHAVLVVGYGWDQDSQLPFWRVKNSWGAEWGEAGFFRIRRGNDECGIESLAVEVEPIP
ncbi:hypothetical protein HPB50_007769 [Hyalomma asiaticum]|uniref:Uncharacterized protein n=1 Tax=Hyalomma asiaticum TaxID=266040 RepID=A0ACB7RR01_HYAAI|nr:hypothetical protein HPB50_007769 [Hyalomma asiaticum]